MPQRRRAARALAAVSALALVWIGAAPAHAEEVAFTITDERITESSGLAADPNRGGYWTVNDSGDKGIAYALDGNGDVGGTLEWQAEPVDVEALAWANNTLYVGDIGDNQGSREFITVFFFAEPSPDGQRQYRAYDFRYPEGARDAEALLADGSGRLYVVTKEAEGGIYAAPREPSREGVNDLEKVGEAPPFVTDGVFLPDGRMALRTYVSVEVVDPAEGYESVARAALPAQPQGETIALDLQGDGLLVGSEGKKSEVLRVPVPDSMGDAPEPPASPGAEETPTPTPSEEPTDKDEKPDDTKDKKGEDKRDEDKKQEADEGADTEGRGRQGTWVALGAALAVALAAGGVVFGVRPRGRTNEAPARAEPTIEEDPPEWDDWFTDEDEDHT